jgi:hypothetical protein
MAVRLLRAYTMATLASVSSAVTLHKGPVARAEFVHPIVSIYPLEIAAMVYLKMSCLQIHEKFGPRGDGRPSSNLSKEEKNVDSVL